MQGLHTLCPHPHPSTCLYPRPPCLWSLSPFPSRLLTRQHCLGICIYSHFGPLFLPHKLDDHIYWSLHQPLGRFFPLQSFKASPWNIRRPIWLTHKPSVGRSFSWSCGIPHIAIGTTQCNYGELTWRSMSSSHEAISCLQVLLGLSPVWADLTLWFGECDRIQLINSFRVMVTWCPRVKCSIPTRT